MSPDLLSSLVQAYTTVGLDCGDELLPPGPETAAQILELEAATGLQVPAELRALWRIHGGQCYLGAGTTGLFGKHRLHTPKEALEHWVIYEETHGEEATAQLQAQHAALHDWPPLPPPPFPPPPGESGEWQPDLILFASWDAYDLCLHTVRGDVWEFNPYNGLSLLAPDITTLLEKLLAGLREGLDPRGSAFLPVYVRGEELEGWDLRLGAADKDIEGGADFE